MNVTDQTSGVSYATLSLAIAGSASGDVLEVPAGSYVENFPTITHSLTIESVGGMAVLTNPQAQPPNDKGVIDVALDSGADVTLSGLDISGAVADGSSNNGAGIRFESGNGTLTVSDCDIHDNQEGILTGGVDSTSPNGAMSVFIDRSEVGNNGVSSGNPQFGLDHNIYAGSLTELSVTNSYVHGALGGSEIKSRAATTVVTGNRIQDEATAPSTYDVDVPNGGAVTIGGNTIEKGASAPNRTMIHFGGEGATYANSSLSINGNTFINDRQSGATALANQTNLNGASVPASITNNTLYNVGANNLDQDTNAPADTSSGNSFRASGAPALDTSPGATTACFATGTLIATLRGAVAVEELRLDDRAVLARGGSRPIVWIGRRAAHFATDSDLPVRVSAHAFGDAGPSRDLVLSPEHAVFSHAILVPVAQLVNERSVARVAMGSVVYWHVELDRHDVILAEGLAVESYRENANRDDFDWARIAEAHPVFAGTDLPQPPCAPIMRQGPLVEQVQASLASASRARMAA